MTPLDVKHFLNKWEYSSTTSANQGRGESGCTLYRVKELNLKSDVSTIPIKIRINAQKKHKSIYYRMHRRNLFVLIAIFTFVVEEIYFVDKNKII